MREIVNCAQNTPSWYEARCGKITASSFSDVLAKGQGKTRRTYMLQLAAEIIRGENKDSFSSLYTVRGHEYESKALDRYIEQTGNTTEKCGFIVFGKYGYSPDFLVGEEGLGEIKTKSGHLQAELVLSSEVPSEHLAQIQGGMMVSGRKWLDFVSYCPGMPLFIKRVERDEEYIKNLLNELEKFSSELDEIVLSIMNKF